MTTHLIYGYADPRCGDECEFGGQIRYIGKSVNPWKELATRLRGDAGPNAAVMKWIRELNYQELEPTLFILGIATDDSWPEMEKQMISTSRAAGFPLLNATSGGRSLGKVVRLLGPSKKLLVSIPESLWIRLRVDAAHRDMSANKRLAKIIESECTSRIVPTEASS